MNNVQCTKKYSYSLTSDYHYRYQHIFIVSNHINVMQCNAINSISIKIIQYPKAHSTA